MATYTYNILSKDGRKLSDKQIYILCSVIGILAEEISKKNYKYWSDLIGSEIEAYNDAKEEARVLSEDDFDFEEDMIRGSHDGCKWEPF